MPPTSPCPPVRDLRRLVQACGDDRDAQPLRRHLDHCERCREILHTFQDEDPPSAPAADEPSGTWKGGVRPVRPTSKVRLPAAPPAAAPIPEVNKDMLDLLSPAQGPDELGRIGEYRLLRVLGAGATGVVFHAEDVQLRRQVALKVMKPVAEENELARQRFIREAQAAAVLDHDHIVTIYRVGEENGACYLAMKLLQGETLDARLKREGQLLIHEILRIGREIAVGLDVAHEHGLVHRDIKPANIFLEAGTNRVKIVDFGLARAVSDDLHLTRTGAVVGTPAYMSPEQARGHRVDHRSDLFSLGSVLYRMCAGRTPFKGDDAMGMLVALTSDQPPPLRAFNADVPDELVGLVAQLLAKPPEARPQSARTVAAVLEAISEKLVAATAPGKTLWRRPDKRERPLWPTLLLLGALAGLGSAGYWYGPTMYRAVRVQFNEWMDAADKTRTYP